MAIWVTGDTHGWEKDGYTFGSVDGYVYRLNTENFPEQAGMGKNDFVVILGDFGGVWDFRENKAEDYCLDWLDKKPFTTLFIPGNHECSH